ncbi:MAG: hypothetical protein V4501_12990 [Pseudomonadota bacterium]
MHILGAFPLFNKSKAMFLNLNLRLSCYDTAIKIDSKKHKGREMLSSTNRESKEEEQKNDELQQNTNPQRSKRKKTSVSTVSEGTSTASSAKKPNLTARVTALEASLSNVREEALKFETSMKLQLAYFARKFDQKEKEHADLLKRVATAESEVDGLSGGIIALRGHVFKQEAHITKLETLIIAAHGLGLVGQNPFPPNMQFPAMPQTNTSQQQTLYVPHQPLAVHMQQHPSFHPQSLHASSPTSYAGHNQLLFNSHNRQPFAGLSSSQTQTTPASSSTSFSQRTPGFTFGGPSGSS